jgi:hypothetical protein
MKLPAYLYKAAHLQYSRCLYDICGYYEFWKINGCLWDPIICQDRLDIGWYGMMTHFRYIIPNLGDLSQITTNDIIENDTVIK